VVLAVALDRERLVGVLVFRQVVVVHVSIVFRHVALDFRGVLHFDVGVALLQCSWVERDRVRVRFVGGWQILDWTVAEWLRRFDRCRGLMRCVQADETVL
jgi:hypothetical protein